MIDTSSPRAQRLLQLLHQYKTRREGQYGQILAFFLTREQLMVLTGGREMIWWPSPTIFGVPVHETTSPALSTPAIEQREQLGR